MADPILKTITEVQTINAKLREENARLTRERDEAREDAKTLREGWDREEKLRRDRDAAYQKRVEELAREMASSAPPYYRRWQEAVAERDEARAEVKKYHDALVARHGGEPVALLEELDASKAEIERLEGLILDWETGPVIRSLKTLAAEARRIRAAKGEE